VVVLDGCLDPLNLGRVLFVVCILELPIEPFRHDLEQAFCEVGQVQASMSEDRSLDLTLSCFLKVFAKHGSEFREILDVSDPPRHAHSLRFQVVAESQNLESVVRTYFLVLFQFADGQFHPVRIVVNVKSGLQRMFMWLFTGLWLVRSEL